MNKVLEHIAKSWEICIRETKEDDGDKIGLPYPYTVPSETAFDELYYWDTYFTNLGLLKSGRESLAKNNVDNMLYLVEKYGFMPNGSRTYYLNRSQPPFLSEMVKDIYESFEDKEWLLGAYKSLVKEYEFWNTKRITPTGLCRYDSDLSDDEVPMYAKMFRERLNNTKAGSDYDMARHGLVTAESGWDMNPRWGMLGFDFAHVDLNSLLYLLEKNMAYFSDELELSDSKLWNERAEKRKELMNKYFLCDEIFYDYDFVNKRNSDVFSVAALYPMFAGLATKQQAEAAVRRLSALDEKWGIATCEKGDRDCDYQWDYPNGWACLQYIVISALDKYGYVEMAEKIAEKYTALVEKVFDETGNLWEKYNVSEGNIQVTNEYEMPTMLGWSAGVYIAAKEYLNKKGE